MKIIETTNKGAIQTPKDEKWPFKSNLNREFTNNKDKKKNNNNTL